MRLLVAVALLACAGCEDRRTFDERYDDTENLLSDKAQKIDNELAADADQNSAE